MKFCRKNFFLVYMPFLKKIGLIILWILMLWLSFFHIGTLSSAPIVTAKVIKVFPHDKTSFTQGLIVKDNVFYESTGIYGQSLIKKVDKKTGKLIASNTLNEDYFGEGLTLVDDKLYQLTWKSGLLIQYSKDSLEQIGKLHYPGEGWGLTFDGVNLILSNGSNLLRVLDPNTLKLIRIIKVLDKDKAVLKLNELEYINSEIWANVWQTNYIACVNPLSGKVIRWVDLSHIDERKGLDDVLNGIAWDKNDNRIYVTGKYWKHVYEISLGN